MNEPRFPRMPYDDVRSTVIQDELRQGAFEDRTHRAYVNHLVYVEWYLRRRSHPCSGLSSALMARTNWRIATKYPELFDAIRLELGGSTRHDTNLNRSVTADPEARKRWAERHRIEWRDVCGDPIPANAERTDPESIADRSQFGSFRFPHLPYDRLQSAFIREELRRGSFDDLEHRRYVNKLVYIEAWARDPHRLHSSGYPPVRPWIRFSTLPNEFDIIRRELGEPTRADLEIGSSTGLNEGDVESRTLRHKQAWQTVQEETPR